MKKIMKLLGLIFVWGGMIVGMDCESAMMSQVPEAVKKADAENLQRFQLSRGKKNTLELGGIALLSVVSDVVANYTKSANMVGEQWFISVLAASIYGKLGAHITDRQKWYWRVGGGLCLWTAASLIWLNSDFRLPATAMSGLSLVINVLFDIYARKTGRSDYYTRELERLPADVLKLMATELETKQ